MIQMVKDKRRYFVRICSEDKKRMKKQSVVPYVWYELFAVSYQSALDEFIRQFRKSPHSSTIKVTMKDLEYAYRIPLFQKAHKISDLVA